MNNIQVQLTKNRECIHSIRYDAQDKTEPVQSVYIKKTAFDEIVPETVTLSVEA